MIKTVILTDCMYRSAISAIYTLKKLNTDFVAVSTDKHPHPPAFRSKYVKAHYVLPSDETEYKEALLELCKSYERPCILPIGAFTLNILSESLDAFSEVADFVVASPEILSLLNDKNESKILAQKSGLSVPEKYNKGDVKFPAVVKPFCGEKFSISASKRYKIVKTVQELRSAIEAFSQYDENPIIEEYIDGAGVGVSVVIDKDGNPRTAFCHRRIAEYPASGGPSSSLVTFKNDALINAAVKFLQESGFTGIAMVEFKECDGKYYFLEVNPRIWGSFGATLSAHSNFIEEYIRSANGISGSFNPIYTDKKRVKFLPNIFASALSYLFAGRIKACLTALWDGINPFVSNPIFKISDPFPAVADIFRKRR